jgi:hypothetical protein
MKVTPLCRPLSLSPLLFAADLVDVSQPRLGQSGGAGAHRMVPLKRTGSWRMMERRERRVCSGSLEMSMPSMTMRPAWRLWHG